MKNAEERASVLADEVDHENLVRDQESIDKIEVNQNI